PHPPDRWGGSPLGVALPACNTTLFLALRPRFPDWVPSGVIFITCIFSGLLGAEQKEASRAPQGGVWCVLCHWSKVRGQPIEQTTSITVWTALHSIIDGRERFRAESERIQGEQAAQERRQRDRMAKHEALARQEDDAIRAKIFARYLRAEEEAQGSRLRPKRTGAAHYATPGCGARG